MTNALLNSTNKHRNMLAYLKHDPINRTLKLQSGHTITYIDELILSGDIDDGTAKGYQDQLVYVTTQTESNKPYYLGIHTVDSSPFEDNYTGCHHENSDIRRLLDQVIEKDAINAVFSGGAERAMQSLNPKR